ADTRHDVPLSLVEELNALEIPLFTGAIPMNTRGFGALNRVSIGTLSRDDAEIVQIRHFACDALAISGGFSPNLHLFSRAGGKIGYCDQSGSLEPISSLDNVTLAGRSAGTADTVSGMTRLGARIAPAGNPRRQWVDFRHDVTVADLQLAVRE